MATRPIFVPREKSGPLVETLLVDIKWHGGFALSQKQKNIQGLHEKGAKLGVAPILEISTKSPEEVGRRLSAFNLKIEVEGEMKTLESVYQSSKVFSDSGQHEFLMDLDPFQSKKKVREVGKGDVIAFRFLGKEYPTEPKNAFYDWLYIKAISPHEAWVRRNLNYSGYTDIEFRPGYSINCQGRAVAEFHALAKRDVAIECAYDFERFRNILLYAQRDEHQV